MVMSGRPGGRRPRGAAGLLAAGGWMLVLSLSACRVAESLGTGSAPESTPPPAEIEGEAPPVEALPGDGGDQEPADEDPRAAAVGQAPWSPPEGPMPGDMLTVAEERRATDLALAAASGMLAAATDRDALGAAADLRALAESPSYRVMYAERHLSKEGQGRGADVAFYRYDTNEVVLTMVDLDDGMVTPLAVPPGYMAPLLPAEVREAEGVAKADDAVQAALEAAGLDPADATANGSLTGAPGGSGSPCAVSRCVRLWFFGPTQIVPTFNVIVDLAGLQVVEIVPFQTLEEDSQ